MWTRVGRPLQASGANRPPSLCHFPLLEDQGRNLSHSLGAAIFSQQHKPSELSSPFLGTQNCCPPAAPESPVAVLVNRGHAVLAELTQSSSFGAQTLVATCPVKGLAAQHCGFWRQGCLFLSSAK